MELKQQEKKSDIGTWRSEKRTHWSPFLKSAQELDERLSQLLRIYKGEPDTLSPGSLSGDFRELYVLSRDEISNLQDCDPVKPRKDAGQVENIRSRVCHELTFAESSLYITAAYLGHSEQLASAEVVEIRSDARHGVAVKAGVVIGSIG